MHPKTPSPHPHHLGLATDLYQLTMAQGYLDCNMADRQAIFHMFFRHPPFKGRHVVAAGLATFVDWLESLHFKEPDIAYLHSLAGNGNQPLFNEKFLEYLSVWRFRGNIEAVPEGTVVFPHEPLVRVRAPLLDAQLIETTLLCIINFQSLIATKASRIKLAAGDDDVMEFGLRRAHGLDGGLSASRAAFIGGANGTSNVQAGARYGIPVKGTHAHSWIMAFDNEPEAFAAYLKSYPHNSVLLIDTYDSIEGVRNAINAGILLRKQGVDLMGIRLDSGDLTWLSKQARFMLDSAGFTSTKILASNDLDERLIASLKSQGAPIDAWGVGTRLVTAFDEPALGGVYKLAAIEDATGSLTERLKLSEQAAKTTIPGCLEVIRFERDGLYEGDVIYDSLAEDNPGKEGKVLTIISPIDSWKRKILRTAGLKSSPLLKPLYKNGKLVGEKEPLAMIRRRALSQLSRFDPAIFRLDNPHAYAAGLSESLFQRREKMKADEFDKIRQRIVTQNGSLPETEGATIMKRALLIIDIQNDFLPGGPLEVPGGDEILGYVVHLIREGKHYDMIVASQDYHPADHGSFASAHPGVAPFDTGKLGGLDQVFWPDHCVMDSPGAELATPIKTVLREMKQHNHKVVIIKKGQDREVDSYSAFFDNNRLKDTGLHDILKTDGIEEVDIVGLALDFCVNATANDAVSLGFTTRILLQGTRAINQSSIPQLRQELEDQGVTFME